MERLYAHSVYSFLNYQAFQYKRILHEVRPVGYRHLWIILSLEAPNLDQLGF
jgi:hypothetical protein